MLAPVEINILRAKLVGGACGYVTTTTRRYLKLSYLVRLHLGDHPLQTSAGWLLVLTFKLLILGALFILVMSS